MACREGGCQGCHSSKTWAGRYNPLSGSGLGEEGPTRIKPQTGHTPSHLIRSTRGEEGAVRNEAALTGPVREAVGVGVRDQCGQSGWEVVFEGRGAVLLAHLTDVRDQGRVGSGVEPLRTTTDGLHLGAQEGPSEPLLDPEAGAGGAEALLPACLQQAGRWTNVRWTSKPERGLSVA